MAAAGKRPAKAAFFWAAEGGYVLPWPDGQAAKQGIGQPFLAEQRASEGVGAASGMLPPEASGALMLSSHVA